MPQQNKITVHFKASGDKALVRAIQELHLAQVRLEKGTKAYNRAVKRLKLDKQKLNKEFGLATKNSRLLSNSFATIRSKMLLATFAATVFGGTIGKLTKLFAEQEQAENKLSTALGFGSQRLLDFASAQQKVTTFGDEATIGAMSMAAAFTKNEAAIEQMTIAAHNLATAKGMDLNTTMDLIAKSVFSSTNALSRYGIEIDSTLPLTEKFNAMMGEINQRYGGQAVADAQTFSGAISQMKNEWGDLGEAIGKLLAEALIPLVQALTSLATALQKVPWKWLLRGMGALGVSILLTNTRLKAGITWLTGYKFATVAATVATGRMTLAVKALGRVLIVGAIIQGISMLAKKLFGKKNSLDQSANAAKVEVVELTDSVSKLDEEFAKIRLISEYTNLLKGQEKEVDSLTIAYTKASNAIGMNKVELRVLQKMEKEGKATKRKLGDEEKILAGKMARRTQMTGVSWNKETIGFTFTPKDEKELQRLMKFEPEYKKMAKALAKLNFEEKEQSKIKERIKALQEANLQFQYGINPALAKQVEILQNKRDLDGAELEIALQMIEINAREADFTAEQIVVMESLIRQKHELLDSIEAERKSKRDADREETKRINTQKKIKEMTAAVIPDLEKEIKILQLKTNWTGTLLIQELLLFELEQKGVFLDEEQIAQLGELIEKKQELIKGLEDEAEAELELLRIKELKDSLTPDLQEDIERLKLELEFFGKELIIQQALLELKQQGIVLTAEEEKEYKKMLSQQIDMQNALKARQFIMDAFNNMLLDGINNNMRFAESFGNMIKQMAASIAAHMATFMIFQALTGGAGGGLGMAFKYALGQVAGINLHKGGLVGGAGDVPTVLQSGEYVMNRDAVQSVGIENLNRMNRGQSNGQVHITFSGNVMSSDFIENEAIPKIKDAIRRGADIGVR